MAKSSKHSSPATCVAGLPFSANLRNCFFVRFVATPLVPGVVFIVAGGAPFAAIDPRIDAFAVARELCCRVARALARDCSILWLRLPTGRVSLI